MKLLLLSLLGAFTSAQICPPAEVLYPCTCYEEDKTIFCMNILGDFNLREIFDNASSFVNDDVVFNRLSILDTPVVELRENDIEHLKFERINIAWNKDLQYISPLAFNASRNVTTDLEVSLNHIKNDPPNERDIFDFVGSFPNLQWVSFLLGNLTSIPDHAFRNLSSLRTIYLTGNQISLIGSNAFSTGGPYLEFVDLRGNLLPSEGLPNDTFNGLISNLTELRLDFNDEMEFMERRSYQSALENAAVVIVGGEICEEEEPCTYKRLYCDERADWICENMGNYRRKLFGFYCKPGAGAEDIWEYCGGRNDTIYTIY